MASGNFDKPKVLHTSSGVAHVKAADILRSRAGQVEISKAASVAVSRHLRKPSIVKQVQQKGK